MPEYIDRNALLAEFEKSKRYLGDYCHDEYSAAQLDRCITDIALIDAFPAADVAPVVHAHWVCPRDPGPYVCSACRKKMKTPGLIQPLHPEEWKYCSECGAKMDEEAKGDA